MKPRFVLCAVVLTALLCASSVRATDLVLDQTGPNMGIGIYPPGDTDWRSRAMIHPEPVADKDRVWSGPDFFQTEFGHPGDFREDLIGKFGYASGAPYTIEQGQLVVRTGPQGFAFGFGGLPNDLERPAVRLGSTWAKNRQDLVRLQMTLDQDVDQSQWTISTASPQGYSVQKSFTISGRGRQTFEADVALVRVLIDQFNFTTGLKLECQTPNVLLHIGQIKLAPSSADIFFRKTFTLPAKPLLAHASFNDAEDFDLYVNDRPVATGAHIYPVGLSRNVDLAPYLKAGANTIAYRKRFFTWTTDSAEALLFEAVAVSEKGVVTHILGDETWKCAFHAPEGWMRAGFDDSAWPAPRLIDKQTGNIGVPHLTYLLDGTTVPNGMEPQHMGMLDVAPNGRRYPLFDDSETPTFRVRLPAGAPGKMKVVAEVYKAGTDALVERAVVPPFHVQGPFSTAIAKMRTRTVGPYRVVWTLRGADGKTVERRREEMCVIGPIPQDKIPLAGFEQNLEKRLERVTHIDCTQTPPAGDEFLDQSGAWSAPQLNKGRVTTAHGMTYRETGRDVWDLFAYRLHGLERGQPYLVELIVPDDQERGIYSAVIETHPVAYFNNGWGAAQYAATGSARTGGLYPLTNRFRKIRYLYTPTSALAAVTVISPLGGSPAAASAINVYRIRGGLPALDVPASARLFGAHEERMTLNADSFGAENPIENSGQVTLSGHRDAWYHWYRILERKISFLRFQGHNMATEGIYMYWDPYFPKKRGLFMSNDDIDLPLLAIKMYRRNGLKLYLGVEYVGDYAAAVDGVDTASDRQVRLGAPTIQTVDRYGRQVGRGVWGNENFLHPTARNYFDGVLHEIYDRYHAAGPVEGVYLATGLWWQPGFTVGAYYNLRPDEVGYEDYTVALFEKETGVSLGIGTNDPQRFPKRYALLMGPHKDKWLAWRAAKVRESFLAVSRLIRSESEKWKLLVEPTPASYVNPFSSPTSTAEQRAGIVATMLNDLDTPLGLYSGLPNIATALELPAIAWQAHRVGENGLANYGLTSHPETGKAVQRLGALAIGGSLDEGNAPSTAVARWIWTGGGNGVYIPRGIEDNAMSDFVNVLTNGLPGTIIYSWLDVNQETAFGPQLRRFTKAFYATPSGVPFTPLPAGQTHGVIAQTAPRPNGLTLRLVNSSPYPLTGSIGTDASAVRDLVYDAALKPQSGTRSFSLSLPPNDIRIISLTGAQAAKIRCRFDFAPAIAAPILTQARDVQQDKDLWAALPAAGRAGLSAALADRDAAAAFRVLHEWQVLSLTATAKPRTEGRRNQTRLLDALRTEGIARIDCGGVEDYRDGDGHLWLPDQPYFDSHAYGFQNATVASRGSIEIFNTRAPNVFQTELWGDHIAYHVPLPNGRYDVSLHFAETYAPHTQPGSRVFTFTVPGMKAPEAVDLVALAGGQYRPLTVTKPVSVTDGLLEIRLNDNALLDGLTIQKATH